MSKAIQRQLHNLHKILRRSRRGSKQYLQRMRAAEMLIHLAEQATKGEHNADWNRIAPGPARI